MVHHQKHHCFPSKRWLSKPSRSFTLFHAARCHSRDLWTSWPRGPRGLSKNNWAMFVQVQRPALVEVSGCTSHLAL